MVDHTLPTKIKDLALIFDQSIAYQDFIFCQKHLKQAFLLTHIHLA